MLELEDEMGGWERGGEEEGGEGRRVTATLPAAFPHHQPAAAPTAPPGAAPVAAARASASSSAATTTTTSASSTSSSGSRFERSYQLLRELGAGAFGRALLARRRGDGRLVCVKVLDCRAMTRLERRMVRGG